MGNIEVGIEPKDLQDTAGREQDQLAERRRWVPRGVALPALTAVRARGARVEGADGRSYIDFAGGIGCQNLGHGPDHVVSAIHEQVDAYLHQCFMVAHYDPYVGVCRRLGELSPCRGDEQKTLLVNSGAEAVENAVKVARAATGRPGVLCFDRGFHGRTLLTMSMTSKLVYKRGFGPFAPEVHRAPAPYPFRGVSVQDAIDGLEFLFSAHVDPQTIACAVLEPVQGEGGFIPMPADYLARLREICDEHGILYVDDEVQAGVGRTGTVWAVEHHGVQPDLLVSGKSLGGGLPLAAVTGPSGIMDAVGPGGLGGTFGGNPVACAAAIGVLDTVAGQEFREQAQRLAERLGERLERLAEELDVVGEARGLGSMLALELVDPESGRPSSAACAQAISAAREGGLILLACGLDANVIRLLPPVTIPDEDLERGLDVLEEALRAAA